MTLLSGWSQHRWSRTVVCIGMISLLATIPHVLEDFVAGIPARFGFSVLAAGSLLGVAYVVHVGGILLTDRSSHWGYGINLVVGLGWLLGALLDHLPDVLSSAPYRAGLPSRALEVAIMLLGAALALASGLALWQARLQR
ncbi:MAG: hypothetical protein NVS4B8_10980 [Herpetosiphon sp.]